MATLPKLRALLCLNNGRNTYSAGIETVETRPDTKTDARPFKHLGLTHELLQRNAVWESNEKSGPHMLTPLPNIQPKCPEQIKQRYWDNRTVYGNANFHMFVVENGETEDFRMAGTDITLPEACDAVIVKVSRVRDPANRCKYESMALDDSELWDRIQSFVEELKLQRES